MPETQTVAPPKTETPRDMVVNDFSIQVATANGSGSQSSNSILIRSIFQMGIPVSGKNLFPSNIQGLPTWYTIRVSKDGWIARNPVLDIVVVMNQDTVEEDVKAMRPGSVLLANDSLKYTKRDDVLLYSVPFGKIVAAACPEVRLRKKVENMIYVGVLQELLGIDPAQVEYATKKQFKGKAKVVDLNLAAIKAGAQYAKENLKKIDPYRVAPMQKTQGKILIEGNAASAIGCLMAGCTVLAWYPITPSSSLAEALIDLFETYRIDPVTKKATYASVQAEDELAAVGMAIGAGWAGARAMTNTSGPGISLMAEFVGFAYYAEIPVVIFDVQRVGPSTGLPTRTSQADILFAATLSHGDTKHIVLVPHSVGEAYQFAQDAFDLAEQFQTPVFVLTDLDLGMNNWMSDPFPYPTKGITRGKVLSSADLDRVKEFARYKDVDGDAIPYRTIPGTKHPLAGYFTRGSGHNEKAGYSEKPEDYKNNMDRLARKYDTARKAVPKPVVDETVGAPIGIIAYGTSHWGVEEARDRLAREGTKTSYLRLRALPFTEELKSFVAKHDRIYVIEQNRDAQMAMLLRNEYPEYATRFRSVLHYNGLPLDAGVVVDGVNQGEGKKTKTLAAGNGGRR